MDIQTLKSKIESLDPGVHGALREALAAKYRTLTGEDQDAGAQSEALDEMFKVAAGEIAEKYVQGTGDHIRKHHPDLYQRTERAHMRLEDVWLAGRQGRAGVEDFRVVLEGWQGLHFEQIEIYAREVQAGGSD